MHGDCDWAAVLPLYAAGVCWTLVYDTIYAHQVSAPPTTCFECALKMLMYFLKAKHLDPVFCALFRLSEAATRPFPPPRRLRPILGLRSPIDAAMSSRRISLRCLAC